MTHLRIEQNTITENVTSDVIHKLYETAKAIIDAEEANEVEESQVSLKGNLYTTACYRSEKQYLESKFPDLHITTGDYIVKFEDNVVENKLLSLYGVDGIITESRAASISQPTAADMFKNTSAVSFNELPLFTNWRTIKTGMFYQVSTLREIDLSNVTGVDTGAFYGCTSLTNLGDTGNITWVAQNGFRGCTALSSIDTSNITYIGPSAFQECTGLTSVDLSAYTAGIAASCFEGCTSLTSVTLPSTSFTWGDNTENHKSVFYGCTSLASIDMSNATFIGKQYFQGCTALTTCIWPTSVTTIPQSCFDGCTDLESLGSKISPTQVNSWAFRNCNKLTQDDINLSSIVTIENSAFRNSGISGVVNLTNCTYIGEAAFNDCAVTEIHGPNVTSISSWSIYSQPTLQVLDLPVCSRCPSCPGATSLTTLNVPSATSFGQYGDLSLSGCRNLTTLNIPFENFTGVGNYAFENCVGLSGQTFDFGTDLQYIGIQAFMNTSINIVLRGAFVVPAVDTAFKLYSGLIYVPDELIETYKTSTGYSYVSSQIKGISELPST